MPRGSPSIPRQKSSRRKYRANPGASEARRKQWQDPVYREKMLANLKRNNRRGIPDGMHRDEAQQLWAKARELGERFIQIMEDADQVEKIVVPGSEAEMAKEVLKEAFVMAVSPLTDTKVKATYQRIVLDFTKAKPESKTKLTLDKSEEWLAALEQDMKKDDRQAGDPSPTA